MRPKSKRASDTTFDRRRTSSIDEERARAGGGGRRAGDRGVAAGVGRLQESPSDTAQDSRRQRRTTRDGRQTLVVYLQPQSIRALKIRALENETTASAIVAEAVDAWLRTHPSAEIRA